uniref:NADH dehydrogenase [ubiquinone] 1 alpha subcomplex assembly factor 3 n=1 Tax=Acrobeloides nanus TaxID=290746 RepID=A0A914CEQ2_9BILA
MASRLKALRYINFGHFRRCFSKTSDKDDIFHGGYHIIPSGKSDVPMQSRISYLSKDMEESQQMSIVGVSRTGFRLNDGTFLFGPIAIFPKTVLSWRVVTPNDITPESLELFFLLQPKLDILILGVGDRKDLDSVRKRVIKAVRGRKIGFEVLPTEDAISIFNHLASEERYIGAALYPPRELVVTDAQYADVLNMIQPWDKADEDFGHIATAGYDRGIGDVITRIWGEPRQDIKNELEQIREMNKLLSDHEREKHENIKQITQGTGKPIKGK